MDAWTDAFYEGTLYEAYKYFGCKLGKGDAEFGAAK